MVHYNFLDEVDRLIGSLDRALQQAGQTAPTERLLIAAKLFGRAEIAASSYGPGAQILRQPEWRGRASRICRPHRELREPVLRNPKLLRDLLVDISRAAKNRPGASATELL